jgi:hypothetical protein
MHYKGYELAPAAQILASGLYAATLTIERVASAPTQTYAFDKLDFFFEADHAVAYASRWARIWVDEQLRTRAQLPSEDGSYLAQSN